MSNNTLDNILSTPVEQTSDTVVEHVDTADEATTDTAQIDSAESETKSNDVSSEQPKAKRSPGRPAKSTKTAADDAMSIKIDSVLDEPKVDDINVVNTSDELTDDVSNDISNNKPDINQPTSDDEQDNNTVHETCARIKLDKVMTLYKQANLKYPICSISGTVSTKGAPIRGFVPVRAYVPNRGNIDGFIKLYNASEDK